jgi:uncharacterized protein (TIGR02246 family)
MNVARIPPNHADNAASAALAAVEAAWNAAATPWTAAALTAVYTDDALFFGGRPGHYVGAQAIHGYFASYDGVIASGRMRLVEQEIRVLSPGVVLAQGFVDFAFVLDGPRETRSRLRTTLVLARQVDGWRICQHHFSVAPETPPLGDDDVPG